MSFTTAKTARTVGNTTVRRRRRLSATVEPLLFLWPAIILLGGIFLVPLITAITDSFTNATLLGKTREFVGVTNYIGLANPEFGATVLRTIGWVGFTVLGATILGVLLAVALDKPIPGRTLFRVILVLPWIFPQSIMGIMWRYTLHPQYGILNNILIDLGFIDDGINFFATGMAFPSALVICILVSFPFVMLSSLAGLQAIPEEVREASIVDGANAWQRFWYITFPYLKPVLITSAVILAAWLMVSFDLLFVLTGGGPGTETELLAIAVYRAGFLNFEVGAASAIATVTVLLVMGFGYFYVKNQTDNAR